MKRFLYVLVLLGAFSAIQAAELKPETAAAFDHYVQVTEDQFAKHRGFEDFLWLDHHPKEKSMVWLQQSIVRPIETPDQGKQIEVPGGMIQHWLGAIYLENTDADHVRGLLMNLPGYQDFFKPLIIGSQLHKQQGDDYDFTLRLYKKQFKTVVLNVDESAKYTLIDPSKWTVACHSTHIGEAQHPKNKKKLDENRSDENAAGYLWRLNFYWRVEQADNGCYVELEVITLAPAQAGLLHPSRYAASFENFGQDLTQYLIDSLDRLFPHHK